MKALRGQLVVAVLFLAESFLSAQQTPWKKFDFEADSVGSPPAGFEFDRTVQGAELRRTVR